MPKYLFIQRSKLRTSEQKPQQPSPAQMQEMYGRIQRLEGEVKDNIVDMAGN